MKRAVIEMILNRVIKMNPWKRVEYVKRSIGTLKKREESNRRMCRSAFLLYVGNNNSKKIIIVSVIYPQS